MNDNSLIRLDRNSFIRIYDDGQIGYINSQLTYHDRVYNETGADILVNINRKAKPIGQIIKNLQSIYPLASRSIITAEVYKMLKSLHDFRFVVIGDSETELSKQDSYFTYDMDNPKTQKELFPQYNLEEVEVSSETFALKHDQISPRLTNIQLELSGRCNERCIHCYIPNDSKNTAHDMPKEMVFQIIREFSEMGGLHITLSGGEALLHPNFKEIVKYCRENDLQTSVLSNLLNLDNETVTVLKDANVSLIQASLYSMDPAIHDRITTVPGSFERTKSAIEILRSNDIPVQISCPIMKANKIGYGQVLEYARSLKIKSQTDYMMMAQSNMSIENLANRISLEETEAVLNEIIEHDRQYDELMDEVKPIKSLTYEEQVNMPICGAGLNELCIGFNGNAFPCAGWQNYVVGNIKENSLLDIWNNSEKLKKLRKIKRKDFPTCLVCDDRDFCSICLVRNYNENDGDMFKVPEHYCKVANLNKRMVEKAKGDVWAKKEVLKKQC